MSTSKHRHQSNKIRNDKSTTVITLQDSAKEFGSNIEDLVFARNMDSKDHLRELRSEFNFPHMRDLPNVDLSLVNSPTEESIYMNGNSLGLQPKGVKKYLDYQLQNWGMTGVNCYLDGEMPLISCDEMLIEDMAELVGAKKSEVAVMNSLTVNLHLMLVSFYRPTKQRHKILVEENAFSSDYFAVGSQIQFHGFDVKSSILEMKPKPGHHTLNTDDILSFIDQEGSNVALVLFGGISYYTGQFFDIRRITEAAHKKGCMVGFDLAHAIGNVPLKLNEWEVDFAVWCSYKYLNSGPGAVAGAFMHETHAINNFPKFIGWWGHKSETRLDISHELDLIPGIAGYRVSCPPLFSICPIRASLDVFKKTSIEKLREKSKLLTGYLAYLIETNFSKPIDCSSHSGHTYIEIITPDDPEERGSQLSLLVSNNTESIHMELKKRGVSCDHRKPNILRIAPNALYNSFEDVWRFNHALHGAIDAINCDHRKPNILRIAPNALYNSFEDVWRFNHALHGAIDAINVHKTGSL